MKTLKHSTYLIKAKGSTNLRNALQYGDVRAIAAHFNLSYTKVHAVISGKHAGDKNIVECAERIAAFYDSVDLNTIVTNIIKSYEYKN